MTQRGWLTPNEGATEFVCRPVYIPIDDELFFMAAVNGALNSLTREWNWEQYGTLTPAQAAEAMLELYTRYTEEECCVSDPCTIPPAFEIDLEFPLRIVRLGDGGFIEELVDGEWVEPTGVYETPEPDEREESTLDERLCMAAANAAYVMEQFYEEATDAYSEFGTAVEVASAILGVIQTLLGVFGQYQAASTMSFGTNAFDTFADLFGLLTGDVWTAEFTEELVCLYLEYATEVDGVIVFDYPAIIDVIHALRFDAGADPDRQILLVQLEYLMNLTGAGGLNVAGGTTGVATYDCTYCDDFDVTAFISDQSGFSAVSWPPCSTGPSCTGSWDSTNNQWDSCNVGSTLCDPGAGNTAGVAIQKTFDETYIEDIYVTFTNNHNGGVTNTFAFELWNNGVRVFNYAQWLGSRTDFHIGSPNVTCDEVRVYALSYVASGTTAAATIDAIRAVGNGIPPW